MDVLIVEPMEPEVLQWIGARHPMRYAPQLERDPRGLRQALFNVRALIIPSSVALDAAALQFAPVLRAVGRLSSGAENLDADACARNGIEVVRTGQRQRHGRGRVRDRRDAAVAAPRAGARQRRPDGRARTRRRDGRAGRHAGGRSPAGRTARRLRREGARLRPGAARVRRAVGALEDRAARAARTGRAQRRAVRDAELLHALQGPARRAVPAARARKGRCWSTWPHSSLFDEAALAEVLGSGRMAAAWFDSMEPGLLDPERPLHAIGNLQITPRVASTTRESRIRSAWAVARRIDEILSEAPQRPEFRATQPDDSLDLEAGQESA